MRREILMKQLGSDLMPSIIFRCENENPIFINEFIYTESSFSEKISANCRTVVSKLANDIAQKYNRTVSHENVSAMFVLPLPRTSKDDTKGNRTITDK